MQKNPFAKVIFVSTQIIQYIKSKLRFIFPGITFTLRAIISQWLLRCGGRYISNIGETEIKSVIFKLLKSGENSLKKHVLLLNI